MMQSMTTEQMISKYFEASIDAVGTLYAKKLYGHVLVLIFSTIDTLGLLDAPPTQTTASGETFKNWVKKYVLNDPAVEFNEIDLWAARCSILHTFTSESDLSKKGKARELQYYSGDKTTVEAQRFVTYAKSAEGGKHLPVHFEDLCQVFFSGLRKFVYDLDANCHSSTAHNERLRKIMQVHPMAAAL